MDITDTLAPKSDQLDAVDLAHTGPVTFTIEAVSRGPADQPVNVKLVEFPRFWRPGKSMRRVLASGWGTDASKWTGRRLTLFCDPSIRFGGAEVGGIRISHMSDIANDLKVPLIITKGKSEVYKVQKLREAAKPKPAPARDWEPLLAMVDSIPDMDTLRTVHQQEGIASAPEHVQAAFLARKGELEASA